jgi:hypothetical protein
MERKQHIRINIVKKVFNNTLWIFNKLFNKLFNLSSKNKRNTKRNTKIYTSIKLTKIYPT